jgi:hypothetical protein
MVKMTIDVVIRRQPVLAPANSVSKFTYSVEVVRVIKLDAFAKSKAFAA